jgi:predicted esterase
MRWNDLVGIVLAAALGWTGQALGQEDVADVRSERIAIGGAGQQEYFLIGARPDAEAPAENGCGLLLVLPGGDGSADFNPFLRRVWKHALPDGFVMAQLVAVPSANPNQIVWPTAKSRDSKQKFTTEAFIEAVVADVKKRTKVDEGRVYALAWSSGGPATYASMLSRPTPLKGAVVAMSVFVPAGLPPVANAKGQRFYLIQSPQDQVTRFVFAERAKRALAKAGASVEMESYDGGHGWHGDTFGMIRRGVERLERK